MPRLAWGSEKIETSFRHFGLVVYFVTLNVDTMRMFRTLPIQAMSGSKSLVEQRIPNQNIAFTD